jgi:ParB-like chromosome segregation protein Spo0J
MVARPEPPVEELDVTMGRKVKVAPQLIVLLKPIDSVKLHPHNLRKHNLDAIVAAIDSYGIMSPLVVQRSTMFICKGNGTWKAAKMLGAEEIPASIVDIDDETAWRYLLDDNKASDLADYDRVKLTGALQELADGGKLGQTLWTLDDLETLQAETGQIKINEPEFAGDYALDPATLAERRARVTQNTGSKMRQTSVILSIKQHEEFMDNIKVLIKAYSTSGVIATVVEAVKREAARHREAVAEAEAEEAVSEEELQARV